MKTTLFIPFFLFSLFSLSQIKQQHIIVAEFIVDNRVVQIDTVSINPFHFKIFTNQNELIKSSEYNIDFSKAKVIFKTDFFNNKTIIIEYKALPVFLTKTYKVFDKKLIIDRSNKRKPIFYELDNPNKINDAESVFSGLETTGFLSRGITMGNNQDGVVNSGFKLQLEGKLSRKVSINATITDNTIPLQNNGYTQRLNEYDRVFVELYSDKWKLTGGDLILNNSNSRYLNFNKSASGLQVETNLKGEKSEITILTSGAIVEGSFKEVKFNGQESNQGPYRLSNNQNQFLLIISDSETVYINGIPLDKEHYIIDYSSAEITFNTTFPINSDMRIVVDFHASEENYTRFVSSNKASMQRGNFNFEIDFYTENDSKNNNLQQDLNDFQKETLSNAGDNENEMYVFSAVRQSFVENKIQYRKDLINSMDVFVHSNNPTDELYSVKFTYVGNNQGNYIIYNTIATGRIFKFTDPINGVKQGDYEPKTQITAPNKIQITTLKTNFENKKTKINTNIAFSNNDKNLFSNIDDHNNQGFAGLMEWNQLLINKKWKLNSKLTYERIDKNFTTIERINKIEFDREWNIENYLSNQSILSTKLNYNNEKKGFVEYNFENLNFTNSFNGIKHSVNSNLLLRKTSILVNSSIMNGNSTDEKSNFHQLHTDIKQQFTNFLIGVRLDNEHNLRRKVSTNQLKNSSFKNQSYGAYYSIKDSLKTKLEIGFDYKITDSTQNHQLKNVNKSNNYYLTSTILQKKTADLSIFLNYRQFTNSFFNNERSLNSKINYRQQLADNFIQFHTTYETSSGTVPQQEFNYLEVDPAKGYYTWIDYNNDGVQDLDEFEIAQFQDEATFVRVLLPSTKFLRTNQTKFSNLLTINPSKWSNSKGFIKNIVAHFINQSNINIHNKQYKSTTFQLNPFDKDDALALQFSFKNNLFFNRGKQHYSITYSYLKSDYKTVFVTGLQENILNSNQLTFAHKITTNWLINLKGIHANINNKNERFISRNLDLNNNSYHGEISYLFNNNNSSVNTLYHFNKKNNNSLLNETLESTSYGLNLKHENSKNLIINSSFNYINNKYNSTQNSPIAYQLMEGLQNGVNFTWSLIVQKKITNFLSVNLNYNGRKSPILNAIHAGTIEVRANF